MLLLTRLKLEYDAHDVRIQATQEWVECINKTLTVCGVYGLLAVDRAEDNVSQCMRVETSSGKYGRARTYQLSAVQGYSATSYIQALEHQKAGNTDMLDLWLYVGFCADRVLALRPDSVPHNQCFDYSANLSSEQGKILERLRSSHDKRVSSSEEGQRETARQYSLAHGYYSRAAAYAFLDDLIGSYGAIFPGCKEVQRAVVHRGRAAHEAGECIASVVRYSRDAAKAGEGSPLRALWQLVVGGFQAAAVALTPWELTLDPYQQLSLGREKDRYARFLAAMAASLVPIVQQYDEQRAVTQASAGTAWLQETGDMLANVFKQIRESPLVATMLGPADTAPPPLMERVRINALVTAVMERVKREASKQSKIEQTIARYLALSDAVNRKLSAAHPHIAECWQKAAQHLRNSCEDPPPSSGAQREPENELIILTSFMRGGPVCREQLLAGCSKVFADLAAGTFTEAASYFAKAQHAVSKEGKVLWREASQRLLKAGLEHVRALEERIEKPPSHHCDPYEPPLAATALERCAHSCAEAAAVVEKQRGKKELHGMEFRLCMALVQIEKHAAGLRTYELTSELGSLRSLLSKVLALVRVQGEPEPQLDAPHLAHLRPVVSPQEAALRRRRTDWLCDAAIALGDIACQYRNNLSLRTTQPFREALKNSLVVLSLVTGTAIPHIAEFDDEDEPIEITDTPDTCERQQRICLRYIEAARAQQAGRALAGAVWQRAAHEEFALPLNVAGG
jgi:hypothetical protein